MSPEEFAITGGLSVHGVHDGGAREHTGGGIGEGLVLYVEISTQYRGEPPASARLLNSEVQRWVDARLCALDAALRPSVLSYMAERYPEIDVGDLAVEGTHLVWWDQVDYLAYLSDQGDSVHFSVEVRSSPED